MENEWSDSEDQELQRDLDDRYAPLHHALNSWGMWSKVKEHLLGLAEEEYPQACIPRLARLVAHLHSHGYGHAFGEIGLVGCVDNLIGLLAAKPARIEEATAELERLNRSPRADDVRHEFRNEIPRRLSRFLNLDERLAKACRTTDAAGVEVVFGEARPSPAEKRPSSAEYVTMWRHDEHAVRLRLYPGDSDVILKGKTTALRVRLILQQYQREVLWAELINALEGSSTREDSSARHDGSSSDKPRGGRKSESLQRWARRTRKLLGDLRMYWHHDCKGVRFDLPVREA